MKHLSGGIMRNSSRVLQNSEEFDGEPEDTARAGEVLKVLECQAKNLGISLEGIREP